MVHLLVYSRLFGLFITNSAEAIKSKPVGSNIVANILDSVENIYFSPGYFCVVLVYFSWLFLHLDSPYPRPAPHSRTLEDGTIYAAVGTVNIYAGNK